MSRQRRSWLWLWLSIAVFVGVMGRQVYELTRNDYRAPVTFSRAEVLNSPVQAGGELHVRMWREKVRDDCPLLSRPYVIGANNAVINLSAAFSLGGPVGTPNVEFTYTIPDLPPGEYVLHDRLSYRCPAVTFDIDQPEIAFTVSE
jgi:hypothetical protein